MTASTEVHEAGIPQARVAGVTVAGGTVTVDLQVTLDATALAGILYAWANGPDPLARFTSLTSVFEEHAGGMANLAEISAAADALNGDDDGGYLPHQPWWRAECLAMAWELLDGHSG